MKWLAMFCSSKVLIFWTATRHVVALCYSQIDFHSTRDALPSLLEPNQIVRAETRSHVCVLRVNVRRLTYMLDRIHDKTVKPLARPSRLSQGASISRYAEGGLPHVTCVSSRAGCECKRGHTDWFKLTLTRMLRTMIGVAESSCKPRDVECSKQPADSAILWQQA